MITALAVVLAISGQARPDACHWIHGRLDLWNGNPVVRIWPVGTKHILGVPGDVPASVQRLWVREDARKGNGARWNVSIYGDFRVCHTTHRLPGRMEDVRLVAARRMVAAPRPKEQLR